MPRIDEKGTNFSCTLNEIQKDAVDISVCKDLTFTTSNYIQVQEFANLR